MICEACKKNQANTHIKTIVNGELTEVSLCADCAREKGIGNAPGGFDLSDLLGSIFLNQPEKESAKRCEKCGASFEEISKTGKIGCAVCYSTFGGQLSATIQRIHGGASHKGKRPGGSALRVATQNTKIVPVKESKTEEKRRLLQEAVTRQDFEAAAKLRDEIKEMEQHD